MNRVEVIFSSESNGTTQQNAKNVNINNYEVPGDTALLSVTTLAGLELDFLYAGVGDRFI